MARIPSTDFSGFSGDRHAQGAMWAHGVLIGPPRSQCFLRIFERFEEKRIYAFRPQQRVERGYLSAARRRLGMAEVELHVLAIGRRIYRARQELRLVVDVDHGRTSMGTRQPVERFDHGMCGEPPAGVGRSRL